MSDRQHLESDVVQAQIDGAENFDSGDDGAKNSAELDKYYIKMGVSTWMTRTLSLKPCFTVLVMFFGMIFLTYMAMEMELLVPASISV